MPTVAGVDSCRSGWVAVLVTFFEDVVGEEVHHLKRFEDIFRLGPSPGFIAVDMPIGLQDEPVEGGRDCDRDARKVLGRVRGSSIFSPPCRSSLDCSTYEEARRYHLNRQSFGILSRVRELEGFMTPSLQLRIREAHPELSFFTMRGLVAALSSKKRREGRDERISLLEGIFYEVHRNLATIAPSMAAADDILDAYACAWTAVRIFRGEAGCLPEDPPLDSRGLRMEIWY